MLQKLVWAASCIWANICCCVLQIEKCREWDDWIEKAFAAMDKSGSGRLSRDDLAAYLCKDGMCLSEQALRQALAEAHRACGDNMTLEVRHPCFHVCTPDVHGALPVTLEAGRLWLWRIAAAPAHRRPLCMGPCMQHRAICRGLMSS